MTYTPYYPTWENTPSIDTPITAAALNNMEAGIGGGVQADTVTVAGVPLVSTKLSSGDANPAFRILGDGKMEWGAGGASALDADLYRPSSSLLRMTKSLSIGTDLYVDRSAYIGRAAPGDDGVIMRLVTSRSWEFRQEGADGPTAWLKLKDITGGKTFVIEDNLGERVAITPVENKILFGSTADVNLYRAAANQLRTDDDFYVGGVVQGVPCVRVTHNATITCPTAVTTVLPFNTERWDPMGMHDNVTNNSRLTAPKTGTYLVVLQALLTATAVGNNYLRIRHMGTTIYADQTAQFVTGSLQVRVTLMTLVQMQVNEWVDAAYFQQTGADVSISASTAVSPEFMAVLVGP